MKIKHVKIRNFRNLGDIDVPLSSSVILVGENNSGKSNFLKAITLPFLTEESGYFGKNLSWIDINDAARQQYYTFLINYQKEIINGKIDAASLSKALPVVSVEVEFEAQPSELYFVKDMACSVGEDHLEYKLLYEYKPSKIEDIYALVKSVLSSNNPLNDVSVKSVKMNLLPTEFYTYSISVPGKGSISHDALRMFKYVSLEAERDDFSRNRERLGSKSLVSLLQRGFTDEDKIKVEQEYNRFFEELKSLSKMDKIINWQENSEFSEAKTFFEHISILPNMPAMQSILNSVRLGYSDEELSLQGLGHRNLILLLVLTNSLIARNPDNAFTLLTIEEPEAHLCINNERLMASFIKAFTENNSTMQLFYSTHSTEFINKMDLSNVIILHAGKAFAISEEISEENRDYLTKNPNTDLFKLFFSRKCILFEGISEEMLLRSYIDSRRELSNIELISFHKGYKEIMKIWKKVNEGTSNKLGIIRDYDGEDKAKKEHEKFDDGKSICVRTTAEYTLEPEIVLTGNNYTVLREKYGDTLGWKDLTAEQLQEAWRNAKASDMLLICKDLASGNLMELEMPSHISEVLEFMK